MHSCQLVSADLNIFSFNYAAFTGSIITFRNSEDRSECAASIKICTSYYVFRMFLLMVKEHTHSACGREYARGGGLIQS